MVNKTSKNNRTTYDVQATAHQTYSSQLTNTLEHTVQQLDILTKTVAILETCLRMTESKLQEINDQGQDNEKKFNFFFIFYVNMSDSCDFLHTCLCV